MWRYVNIGVWMMRHDQSIDMVTTFARTPLMHAHTAIPHQVLNLARAAATQCRETLRRDIRVYWFGSWVKGCAIPRSDIDLAIDAGQSIAPDGMAALRERLDALPTLRQIDLLDIHAVDDALRHAIISEGIAL